MSADTTSAPADTSGGSGSAGTVFAGVSADAASRRLSADELRRMNAYWRAANYLSVGQIDLLDNPLLRTPLTTEHVKPRLLGHWGTTPGLNLIYLHLNRVIKRRNLSVLYVTGPGHGGPGLVANAYLEGRYTEIYSSMTQDEDGMRRLFRQFSFPAGSPATTHRSAPAPFTRAASSGMRSATPSEPPSTTRT